MDPLANDYSSWSPYDYCYNNPLVVIDSTGKAGIKLNLDFVFNGGIFNSTMGIGIGYDFTNNSLIVENHNGIGGKTYSKGISFGGFVTLEYFSNTIEEGGHSYALATYGTDKGLAGYVKLTVPVKDINNVKGLLPSFSQLKKN